MALAAALVLACCTLAPRADGSHDRAGRRTISVDFKGSKGARVVEDPRSRVMRLLGGGKPPSRRPAREEEHRERGRSGGSPGGSPGGLGSRSTPLPGAEGGVRQLGEAERAQGLRWLAYLVAAERKSGWALFLFNKTAGMGHGDASSLCMISRILGEARGDLGQARTLAARALALEPGSAEATKLFAACAILDGHGRRESEDADMLLSHVLELDPADVEAACLRGRGLLAKGQGRAAVEMCHAALQHVKDPKAYARGLHACANLMRDSGRFSSAQKAYARLLGVTPDADVLCDYALLCERMQGTQAAQSCAELYQHALSACPTHTSALINYANLVARGDGNVSTSTDEALEMLRAAAHGSPDSIPACMGLAALMLAGGQGSAAVAVTREAATKFPASFEVLSRHAYVLHCTGRTDEAEAAYREALAASPTHADTAFNIATLQHARAISSQGGAQRREAESWYRRALELDPQHAEAALNLGVLLHVQGKAEADRWLSRASGLIPRHIPTLTTYAGVLARGGELDRSMQLYLRAMALDPHDKQLLLEFARFQDRRQKNVEEASRLYRRVIQMDPTDVPTMVECASMLHDVGNRTSQARAIYFSALAVDPMSSAVLFGIGHVAEADGDLIEAENFYHKAVVADPGHVSAWNNYGRLLETNRGEFARAEKAYQCALKINPKHSLSLYNYGGMLQTQRRFHRAEECYRRFLRFCVPDKVHGSVLCNYGLLLEELRKYDQAEQKYKQAMLLEPTDCSTMVNHASLLNEVRGDVKGASVLYARAIALSPADTAALCSYGRMLHLRLAQHGRAEELFQRALRHDPAHVPTLVSYSVLLRTHFKDLDKAQVLLDLALRLNPQLAQEYLAV